MGNVTIPWWTVIVAVYVLGGFVAITGLRRRAIWAVVASLLWPLLTLLVGLVVGAEWLTERKALRRFFMHWPNLEFGSPGTHGFVDFRITRLLTATRWSLWLLHYEPENAPKVKPISQYEGGE